MMTWVKFRPRRVAVSSFLRAEQEPAVTGDGDDLGAPAQHGGGHGPGQGDAEGLLAVGEQPLVTRS